MPHHLLVLAQGPAPFERAITIRQPDFWLSAIPTNYCSYMTRAGRTDTSADLHRWRDEKRRSLLQPRSGQCLLNSKHHQSRGRRHE